MGWVLEEGAYRKEWGAEKGSVFLPITKEFISCELGQRMREVSFQAFTPPSHPPNQHTLLCLGMGWEVSFAQKHPQRPGWRWAGEQTAGQLGSSGKPGCGEPSGLRCK